MKTVGMDLQIPNKFTLPEYPMINIKTNIQWFKVGTRYFLKYK